MTPKDDKDVAKADQETTLPRLQAAFEVFAVAVRLGLTSFGGPIAHLGYFRSEYVERRRWLDEASFADLVAIAQALPGAASSKLGISIGMIRAGYLGGLAAWLGFTLPSALAMIAFAAGLSQLGPAAAGWIHGLKIVAVAVVAVAVWNMAQSLAPDKARATLAIGAAVVSLAVPTNLTTVSLIVVGAIAGWRLLPAPDDGEPIAIRAPVGRRAGLVAAGAFLALLIVLPALRVAIHDQALSLADSFYRAGALVFGGGNVVLPLLQVEVIPPGWVTNEEFLAGYGAAQAVPGPLFTFAAYLGAAAAPEPNGAAGGFIALIAIFVPSFLIAIAALSWWAALRSKPVVRAMLRGVNATVVGILLAALYHPVGTGAIGTPLDFALALASFGFLAVWHLPAWLVVLATAAGGAMISSLP